VCCGPGKQGMKSITPLQIATHLLADINSRLELLAAVGDGRTTIDAVVACINVGVEIKANWTRLPAIARASMTGSPLQSTVYVSSLDHSFSPGSHSSFIVLPSKLNNRTTISSIHSIQSHSD
jgi:hypothetical protein